MLLFDTEGDSAEGLMLHVFLVPGEVGSLSQLASPGSVTRLDSLDSWVSF